MEHIVFGILAQVDAGKTTLSESILLNSGVLKNLGRVDKKDTFLDNYPLERERGITIFSKQAEFSISNKAFTLLDTPGHIDFSAEMERVLSVLDFAVLVISASVGVQSQVLTIWKLLKYYSIPVFIFVNKMDMPKTSIEKILGELKEKLDSNVIKYVAEDNIEYATFLEEISLCDETVLESYLEGKSITLKDIKTLIKKRNLFPVFFGSALRNEGVSDFLENFAKLTSQPTFGDEFSARVFKISKDSGNRLTHMKIISGTLSIRETVNNEKITGIRVYSGERYTNRETVYAGEVCAVTGLKNTTIGDGLGTLSGTTIKRPFKQVMSYKVKLPPTETSHAFFPKIKELFEEMPELSLKCINDTITISLMGEVQIEVLKNIVKDRYNVNINFVEGTPLYKETIAEIVYGVGHFEPLKHYAEVELRLEPSERGSGITVESEVSENDLPINYQRLILSHIEEKEHKGVLTGFPITDIKITLVAGKSHLKHTEGGDFRQATYRAVRQALMQANSILLEPMYEFKLEVPEDVLGKVMTDISKMHGKFGLPAYINGKSVLTGSLPVAEVKDYALKLRSYTKGEGQLYLTPSDYENCHNTEEVVENLQYYPEMDIENTADSVFCSHGVGFIVPWNEVINYMHLPYFGNMRDEADDVDFLRYKNLPETQVGRKKDEIFLGTEEVDKILNSAVSANRRKEKEPARNRWKLHSNKQVYKSEDTVKVKINNQIKKDNYLIVDGYNIIFAWNDLKELAGTNIDSAKDKLIEKLANYQGYKGCKLILVFDAYRVHGGRENVIKNGNMWIVYTKEAETADQYIAKTSHELVKNANVRVATSDALVQMIIFGSGAARVSARELEDDVKYVEKLISEKID